MGSTESAHPRVAERVWIAGILALLACACSRREPPPPPPAAPPSDVDRQILESAMHQCFTTDCGVAHERAAEISADSPLRQSDDFRAIEFRFDVDEFLRAERENDFDKKRAMLDRLRNSPSADVTMRAAAAERLARLGNGRAAFELALTAPIDAGADAGEAGLLASLLRSKQPDDYQKARAILEPKIYGGRATPDDVRTMTTVCKAQKDTACLTMLKTLVLR